MDLTTLKKSISDLPTEDLLKILAEMRSNRRKPSEKRKPKRKAAVTKGVQKALEGLSADDIKQLQEMLDGN